jgi:hypothetical protein
MSQLETTICLNCQTPIHTKDKFCKNCGQKANTHRLSMHDIGHELLHAFTHADKGILFLIKELIQHPGFVIKEYIEGKRKKYFSPFTFLLIIVGISTLAMNWSGFIAENPAYAKMPNNPVKDFFTKHVNIVILLNVPLLAMFNTLFFYKQLNYAENLVVAAFTSGIRSIFFTLLIAPLWLLVHNWYYIITISYIIAWFIFYASTCMYVYQGKKWLVFAKGILVTVFTQALTIAVTSIALYLYFKSR